METKTWHVELYVYEDGHTTKADAVLRTSAGTELRHSGTARRNPIDRDIPEIGDELAVSRALAGLAHDLLEATIQDVEQNIGAEATITP